MIMQAEYELNGKERCHSYQIYPQIVETLSPQIENLLWRIGADRGGHWEMIG
jgi:hypothetical protein